MTTCAVISGVLGAGMSGSVAIILGFANLIADGFSMAVSNYQSTRTDEEIAEEARRSEAEQIDEYPEGEREELRQIYRLKGFDGEVLETIVDTLSADRELWIETMLSEELGVDGSARHPVRSAVVTFAAFVAVGVIPLLPFLFAASQPGAQFSASLTAAAFAFFGVGAIKGYLVLTQTPTHKPPGRSRLARAAVSSGFATMLIGMLAASLAFGVGYLVEQAIAG